MSVKVEYDHGEWGLLLKFDGHGVAHVSVGKDSQPSPA